MGLDRRRSVSELILIAAFAGSSFAQTTFTSSGTITMNGSGSGSSLVAASPYGTGGAAISVSGLTGTTSNLQVRLNGLSAVSDTNVNILLVSPTGDKLVFLTGAGCGVPLSNLTVTFDDSAASQVGIPETTPPCFSSSTFKPSADPSADSGIFTLNFGAPGNFTSSPANVATTYGTGTLGNVFNGKNPNGTWQLYVADSGTTGSITSWSLIITTVQNQSPTSTAVSSSSAGNKSFTGDAVTFTATVTSSGNPVTSGTVTFTDGASAICTGVAVNGSGQASCTTSSLSQSIHTITGTYNGTASFGQSSGTVTQTVTNHTTNPSAGQYCNTGPIAIPNAPNTGSTAGDPASPYPSSIFVGTAADPQSPNLTGSIAHLTLSVVGFTHQSQDDVSMLLVGPGVNKTLDLWSRVGQHAAAANNLNITLDDAAGSLMPQTALSSTTYKPTAYDLGSGDAFPAPAPSGFPFSAPHGSTTIGQVFNGLNPNGTWQLYAVDLASGLTGSISGGWCLTFTVSNDPATTTTATSSSPMNLSFTGDAVTFTATVKNAATNAAIGAYGTVTFTDEHSNTLGGGPVLVNASGQAAVSVSNLSEAIHTITATYSGSSGNFATSFGSVQQEVSRHSTVNGTSYCNPGPITIPSSGVTAGPSMPYPSRIFVGPALDPTSTALAGTVNKVTVTLNGLTYSFPQDLQSLLIGPLGTAANGLDFFSHTSNGTPVSNLNLTFDDAAATRVGSGNLVAGTFKPTSSSASNVWPSPVPTGPYLFAGPAGFTTFGSLYANSDPNGEWSLYFASTVNGSSGTIQGPVCLNFTENPPDLSITKSHSGNFRQGDQGKTYTITVSNAGPGNTGGTVTVNDTLPSGLTATAMSGTGWTCTLSPLRCTSTTVVAPSQSYPPITLSVNVAANAAATVTNSATLSGSLDNTPGNNTASDPTTVIPASDMTIAKTHSGTFTQGDTGKTFTITATNSGAGPTVGTTTVTDNVPSGLTATNIAGTGWTCTQPSGPCTRSDVLAGVSSYPALTLTVDVAANAAASIVNTAVVSGGGELNTANDTASDTVTVVQLPDLTVSKSHSGNFFQGQSGAQYSITVTNSGAGAVVAGNTVTVTDTLPAGLTATAISGTGWSCVLNTLTCTRSDALTAGGSYPAITLTVNVAANAAASLVNNVTVSGGGELNTANDSAADTTTVSAGPDLTIAKTHSGNFTQGDTGKTYAITVSNGGVAASYGTITVTDTVPAGLTPTGAAGTGWTCGINLQVVTCTSTAAIAGSQSGNAITLTVSVAANATSPQVNQVAVSGGGDVNPNNNSATDSTVINQLPDLTIAKSHTGNFVQGQAGAQYTITVSNAGTGSTSGTVTMSDTLPSGLTPTGASGSGWACGINTQVVTCTRADALGVSSAYPAITLTVSVAGNAPASVINTATVSGGGDISPGNNSASDPATINPGADLTVGITHSGVFGQGQIGDAFAITVSNVGPGATNGSTVSVTDILSTGLTPISISGSGWSCTLGTLTCTRADVLAAGASYPVITVGVNIASNAPASVSSTATVSGGGDGNAANNSAQDTVAVTQNAVQTLSGAITAKTGAANARVWTIAVTNNDTNVANGAQISSLSLTQTSGVACTPVITSAFPVAVGAIPSSGGTASGNVTIDFSACSPVARFTATAQLSANAGANTGIMTAINQFR